MGINSRKNSLMIIGTVGVVLAAILAFQWFLSDDEYLLEMKRSREKRDKDFAENQDSPIPDSLRTEFKGLAYFEVDKKYKVTADFEKNPKLQKYKMARTNGDPEVYIIAGWANFKINGEECRLTCFQENPRDAQTLFVPFKDATSGKTTYGGGRYLNVRLNDDKILMDFNKAFNPYCVYDYTYICPMPPAENTLKVAIEAGEKDFSWDK